MKKYFRGFTIVEIIVIVVVLGILATVSIVGYGAWRHGIAEKSVKSDLLQATSSLTGYQNFHNNYPPNLAGTGFASSKDAILVLYTNAPFTGVYEHLDSDQNAQLFLNVCNANLTNTTNTVCAFEGAKNGAKIHVKGTSASNVIWASPIAESDVVLTCGSNCSTATTTMISQFKSQGGVFPIVVNGKTVGLPEPTKEPNGPADRYCLEGKSAMYTDILFHTSSDDKSLVGGKCPDDPTLHYFK